MAWNGVAFAAVAELAGRARSGAALGVQQTGPPLAVSELRSRSPQSSLRPPGAWRTGSQRRSRWPAGLCCAPCTSRRYVPPDEDPRAPRPAGRHRRPDRLLARGGRRARACGRLVPRGRARGRGRRRRQPDRPDPGRRAAGSGRARTSTRFPARAGSTERSASSQGSRRSRRSASQGSASSSSATRSAVARAAVAVPPARCLRRAAHRAGADAARRRRAARRRHRDRRLRPRPPHLHRHGRARGHDSDGRPRGRSRRRRPSTSCMRATPRARSRGRSRRSAR